MKTYTCMKKNVIQWVQDYKERRIYEARRWCYQYYNWNCASLQSHLLDDPTEEERQSVLDNTFENSDRMRNSHFCVFRMSPHHREDLLKRFSLLVLGIYLLWSNQRFFWMPSKNDEAHFWLNGYVNKQNCRIWSEGNPQVYVETPLPPEKLTVFGALYGLVESLIRISSKTMKATTLQSMVIRIEP
ncbi:hypothetical protein TNCV_2700771 [Trichonephila clavipes]|nr:hypothetical protein TNCV_2700771 [Trichonephila clavipes]